MVTLLVPPLRERQEDITLLARYFLETYSRELGPAFRGFSPEAMDAIMAYAWPGNVREMQNRIRRAVVMGEGTYITAHDLDLEDIASSAPKPLREVRDEAEMQAVNHALARTGFNITQAARILDVSRPTLHDLIRKHGIVIPK